jgi:hypothetical protein
MKEFRYSACPPDNYYRAICKLSESYPFNSFLSMKMRGRGFPLETLRELGLCAFEDLRKESSRKERRS